jgi:hypothetical protein
MSDGLPTKIDLGEVSLTVKQDFVEDGYGYWDPNNHVIVVAKDQTPVQKHIILMHELIHVADEFLVHNGVTRSHMSEDTVTNLAPLMLALLSGGGLYSGLDPKLVAKHFTFVAYEADEQDVAN